MLGIALKIVASPIGRVALVAALFAMVLGWAWLERGGRHRAVARAEAAESQAESRARAIAALEAAAAEAAANAERLKPARRAIHAAPPTNSCTNAPAIRVVIDQLRQDAGSGRAR
jgi:hypothetical protein